MTRENKKSFWALIVTQFFGAFNDNVLKTLVTILVVFWVDNLSRRNSLVSASGAVFVAPFLIFSMIAGRVSDRIGKTRVIVATKFWELLVIAAAIVSLLYQSIHFMMVTLFLLSMQATFFSPAKYGVLPELMSESELPDGNAFLNLSTFAAILLGTIIAGFIAKKLEWACAIMGAASLLGLISSFFMEKLPPAKPHEPLGQKPAWLAAGMGFVMVWALLMELHHRHWYGWEIAAMVVSIVAILICFTIANAPDIMANWKIIRKDRPLMMGSIAVNYFWFMGAILQLNIFLYAKDIMDLPEKMAIWLVVAVMIGIGAGSCLCAKLSRGKAEMSLVPWGALGMSIFAIDLLWAYQSFWRAFFDFFMLGASAGFYEIPLMALIQWRSPKAERGRVMATINFFSFVAILLASGVLWFLSNVLEQNPAHVFFTLGSVSLICVVLATSGGKTFFGKWASKNPEK